jgi:predicted RNase H-like HicB family nuclease
MAEHALDLLRTNWANRFVMIQPEVEVASLARDDRFAINIFWSDEDDCYVADVPDLSFCSAFGGSPEEALRKVLVAKSLWLDVAKESGKPIPQPVYRPSAS